MSDPNALEPPSPAAEEPAVFPEPTRSGAPVSADDEARRLDKSKGTIIVIAAFVVSLVISLWAKHASRPEVSEPAPPPSPQGVMGFPDKVDAVATLGAARALTKRSLLRGITLEGVKHDGTVAIGEEDSRVRYFFQSPPGQGPQPPREPGTLPRQQYCGKQTVTVRKEGMGADIDKADTSCVKQVEPLPDPQCNVKTLWARAAERGAPTTRRAKIEYFRAKAGPAWRFEISGTKHRFTLSGDCATELEGSAAQNIGP